MLRIMNRLKIIAAVLSLVPLAAFSQEVRMLTLEACVSTALQYNPEIQIAEKEVKKTRAGIWEAYAEIGPALNASANFQHAWEIQKQTIPNFLKPMLAPLAPVIPELADMPDFVQLSFGLENMLTYGLTLTQPVFLGGAGWAGVRMAHSAHHAAEHQLESIRQLLIYQTANAFYGCILARELIAVQEEAVKQAEANLDVVMKKYNAGSASGFEKMRAEVEVANLKPELIAAKNAYQSGLTGLRMVLGLSEDVRIEVSGDLRYSPDSYDGVALEELQSRAFKNRPELLGFSAQKEIARKGITLARSQFMPKLFFTTDYSFLAMKNDIKFHKDDFSKGFFSAFSLQIPLFNGLKNHKQIQKSRLDYKITLDSETQIRDGIAAEVEIAYNTYDESKEKYAAARESIDLAEEALRLANLTYDEGASTQLDVMSSQLALTRARMNHAMALYEYQMARYELRRVSGMLDGVID